MPDEDITFDHSGAGGRDDIESASGRSKLGWNRSEQSTTDTTSQSQENVAEQLENLDFTSESSSSRGEEIDESYSTEFDGLSVEVKEERLKEMFPALKTFDVAWTLKKCKGDAGKAIEELMTQAFLEESGGRKMGVDAFSENHNGPKPRKVKGKKKPGVVRAEGLDVPNEEGSMQSQWNRGTKDTTFLSDKLGIPISQVKAIYHANGASTAKTIAAIIASHMELSLDLGDLDPMIQINAFDLHQEFPTIPTPHLEALLQLTHPSVDDARELANALTSSPAANNRSPIQIEIRHSPLDLSSSDSPPQSRHSTTRQHHGVSAAAQAQLYTALRDNALTNASSAYRRGRSDHLMGGAAAYYADQARDFNVRAKSAQVAAADAHVASQSSKTELDLHGVDVKNAVRIAKAGVARWWDGLGEVKATGRVGTYTIVTGLGRHSVDGRARLGPAVMRILIAEGWKVSAWSGYLEVTGKSRK